MEAEPVRDDRLDPTADEPESPNDAPTKEGEDPPPRLPVLHFRRRAMFSRRTGRWHKPTGEADDEDTPRAVGG
jgi:hypothetical protein